MQTKRETFHAKEKGEWTSFPFQIADKPYEEVTEGLQPSVWIRIDRLCRSCGSVSALAETIPCIFHGRQLC